MSHDVTKYVDFVESEQFTRWTQSQKAVQFLPLEISPEILVLSFVGCAAAHRSGVCSGSESGILSGVVRTEPAYIQRSVAPHIPSE